MSEAEVALYGGALWVGPMFLAGYVLLIWWLRDGPFTKRGKRRAKRREQTPEELAESFARARAERLYAEGKGPRPTYYDELLWQPRTSWWRRET